MKKIFLTTLIILTFRTLIQAQSLTDSLVLGNTQDITKIFQTLNEIQARLTALESGNSGNSSVSVTSTQIDSLKKEFRKLTVTKAWVVNEIINRAVLDTTYAGNKGITRRDGKPLMHKQIAAAQKQNQKIAVQASADVFTVQEYLTSVNNDSVAVPLLKRMRANARKMKEEAEKAGHHAEDIRAGKIVVIRRH